VLGMGVDRLQIRQRVFCAKLDGAALVRTQLSCFVLPLQYESFHLRWISSLSTLRRYLDRIPPQPNQAAKFLLPQFFRVPERHVPHGQVRISEFLR
jgi:hypothetical protein